MPVIEKSSIGIDGTLAAALAYLGGVFSAIVLLVVEKDSKFVRFHAMQSLLTFLAVAVVWLVAGSLPLIGWLVARIFVVGVVVLWAFLMFKAVNGEMYKLPYIGDIAAKQNTR